MTRMANMTDSMNSLRSQAVPAETLGYTIDGPRARGGFRWAVSIKRMLTGEAVSQKHLLIVTSQLAVMLAAGCDLCAGLEALAKQQAHPTLKRILGDLHARVKQGQSFSASLAQHPDVFSDLYVTMVRAGESAGLLRHMLSAL